MADEIAGWVRTLAGDDLDQVLLDYDWICKLAADIRQQLGCTG